MLSTAARHWSSSARRYSAAWRSSALSGSPASTHSRSRSVLAASWRNGSLASMSSLMRWRSGPEKAAAPMAPTR